MNRLSPIKEEPMLLPWKPLAAILIAFVGCAAAVQESKAAFARRLLRVRQPAGWFRGQRNRAQSRPRTSRSRIVKIGRGELRIASDPGRSPYIFVRDQRAKNANSRCLRGLSCYPGWDGGRGGVRVFPRDVAFKHRDLHQSR